MLRVAMQDDPTTPSMTMEGRLVGAFAEDAAAMVLRSPVPPKRVDLTELTFADRQGEAVLLWLAAVGAKFIAESSYALDLCDRLRLPIANEPCPSQPEGDCIR